MCKTCGEHRQFAFETLDEPSMAAAARAAHEAGEAWHFHVLAPGCTFSPDRQAYTFLLELVDQGRTICSFFEEKPVAVNKDCWPCCMGPMRFRTKERLPAISRLKTPRCSTRSVLPSPAESAGITT